MKLYIQLFLLYMMLALHPNLQAAALSTSADTDQSQLDLRLIHACADKDGKFRGGPLSNDETIASLICKGANPNAVLAGRSPLEAALTGFDAESAAPYVGNVRALLAVGADATTISPHGFPWLETLFLSGETNDYSMFPLQRKPCLECACLLLDKGAPFTERIDTRGNTLINMAVKALNYETKVLPPKTVLIELAIFINKLARRLDVDVESLLAKLAEKEEIGSGTKRILERTKEH